MLDLPVLKNRVRALLDDPGATRFSDTLLESAARHALAGVSDRLPKVVALEIPVTTTGRDQSVAGLAGCLRVVELSLKTGADSDDNRNPAQFTYNLEGDALTLRFTGPRVPQAGEQIRLTLAAQHTLAGLDAALTTSLPEAGAIALEFGTAAHACLLRSAALAESYGARPGECGRLLEQAKTWLARFDQALTTLAAFQEFGFPPGFALDASDRKGA